MGKSLYLLRHAKSDWSVPGQLDFNRDLNPRGLQDAPKVGRRLAELIIDPEIIIASPAKRANITAGIIAESIKFNPEEIIHDKNIYEASLNTLLKIINELDNQYSKVMLVGHNPGFTLLYEYLTNQPLGELSTCGFAAIDFEFDQWAELSGGTGIVKHFVIPKAI